MAVFVVLVLWGCSSWPPSPSLLPSLSPRWLVSNPSLYFRCHVNATQARQVCGVDSLLWFRWWRGRKRSKKGVCCFSFSFLFLLTSSCCGGSLLFFHHDRFFLQLLLLLLFIFVQIIDGGAMNQTDRACLLPTVRKGLEEVRQSLANFQYPEGCK